VKHPVELYELMASKLGPVPVDSVVQPDISGMCEAPPDLGCHEFVVPSSLDQILSILRALPPDAICLVGYVGADGDYKALTEADLRRGSE
jgi:hypothetical protein